MNQKAMRYVAKAPLTNMNAKLTIVGMNVMPLIPNSRMDWAVVNALGSQGKAIERVSKKRLKTVGRLVKSVGTSELKNTTNCPRSVAIVVPIGPRPRALPIALKTVTKNVTIIAKEADSTGPRTPASQGKNERMLAAIQMPMPSSALIRGPKKPDSLIVAGGLACAGGFGTQYHTLLARCAAAPLLEVPKSIVAFCPLLAQKPR